MFANVGLSAGNRAQQLATALSHTSTGHCSGFDMRFPPLTSSQTAWLVLQPKYGVWPSVNTSTMVIPNDHTSEACNIRHI
jgi:hypothetical protein